MHQILFAAQAVLLLTLHGSCRSLTIGDRDTRQTYQDPLEPKLAQINSQKLKNIAQNLLNVPKPIYTAQCDDGYTSVEGHCYKYYEQLTSLSYLDWNSVCSNDNPRAFLATPKLSADDDEFGVLIKAYFPTANNFWIGYKTVGEAISSPSDATITLVNSNDALINVDAGRWSTSTPTANAGTTRTLFVTEVGPDWKIDIEDGVVKHNYLCQH